MLVRVKRGAVVLTMAVPLMMLAGPASAQQTGEVAADQQAWASSTTVGSLRDPVANLTLGQGDLPVGADGTTETKRSYLVLDLPPAATSAQITLPVSDHPGRSFGVPGPILACIVVEHFTMQSGEPIATAPEVDCGEDQIIGQPGGDGAYSWVLDPILARWAAGEPNNGIALVADTLAPQPTFQITFHSEYFAPIGTFTVAPSDGDGRGEESAPPPSSGSDVETDAGTFALDPPPAFNDDFALDAPLSIAPAVPLPVPGPAVDARPAAVAEPARPVAVVNFEPLPVNPLVWVLAPLAVGVLWACGGALADRGAPSSALDRLLARVASPA